MKTLAASVLVSKGFEAVEILGWSQSSIPDVAVAAILHYYDYEAGKRCSEQVRLACEAFESIGVRAWMQDIMGWTKPATQPQEQPSTPALPPVEQRLHTLVLAMKTLAELTGGRLNPYTEQQFKDYAANLLTEHNRKMLIPSEERWLGVVNFAESELGKKVALSGTHYRGHLGTWVSSNDEFNRKNKHCWRVLKMTTDSFSDNRRKGQNVARNMKLLLVMTILLFWKLNLLAQATYNRTLKKNLCFDWVS